MENCFTACGCDDYEGITQADLDLFTDKIENVLNNDKGRKLFRNFMYTSKMRSGRKVLDFWEQADKCLNYRGSTENISYRRHLEDIDNLIDEADRIDELDLATMERLTNARISENQEAIAEALIILKSEATKALRREYNAFRRQFLPK